MTQNEKWEELREAMRGFLKFPDEETADNWAKFTNSLLSSHTQRIVEAGEKLKKQGNEIMVNEENANIIALGSFNSAISSYQQLIKNL